MAQRKKTIFEEAAATLYELEQDEAFIAQCLAREEYLKKQKEYAAMREENKKLEAELDVMNKKLEKAKKDLSIAGAKLKLIILETKCVEVDMNMAVDASST